MGEKVKSFWAASTTNKLIVVGVVGLAVWGGKKLYDKRKK
jgi:predicted negative regulator of RcsB-dependent stress response